MTGSPKWQPSGPQTQRLFNAFQIFRSQITGGNRMKEIALSSAFRMLAGAGVLPSTFDPNDLTEEYVNQLLTTGIEVLRMIKEGDDNSGDDSARALYRDFFARTTIN